MEQPFPDGIMESENLINDGNPSCKCDLIKGPIVIEGSNRYFNIFRKRKFISNMHIFRLPDSQRQLLINDFQNLVDFSTFLNSGDILVKLASRFLVFNTSGEFIDEVIFTGKEYEIIGGHDSQNSDYQLGSSITPRSGSIIDLPFNDQTILKKNLDMTKKSSSKYGHLY
jgi:hypothetical protein